MAYVIYWFLYQQQKYRIYFISSFYALSMALVLLRLTSTSLVLVFSYEYDADWEFNTEKKAKSLLIVLCFEAFSTYSKVSIGLLLASAIYLLTHQVQQQKSPKWIKLCSKRLYTFVTIFVALIQLAVSAYYIVLSKCLSNNSYQWSKC